MSTVKIALRLSGNLPSPEELTQTLGVTPTKVLRRGDRSSKKRVQPVDLWYLELVNFDMETPKEEEKKQLQQAAIALFEMAPALTALDRSECNACLYISTIREEDRGGFSLPSEFIVAAAAGNLSIETSILVMLDDYEESLIESALSTSIS